MGCDERGGPVGARWLTLTLWLVSLAAAAAMGAPATAAAPAGPSFACVRTSEIEALVCGDAELAAADRRMAAFYAAAKAGALGTGSSQLTAQRRWLEDRDKLCAPGSWTRTHSGLRGCLVGLYDGRLKELAIANLMTSPKESLAELTRIRAKAAPLYRAAYDFATIDEPKRRTAVVAADLEPVFAAMDGDTRDQISSAAPNPLTTAHDAAASDENFAAFFALYSVYGDDDLIWPCGALIRRPGLIAGLGSRFGSSMDSHIPASDCDDALPPTDEVKALMREAWRVQPFDTGTIRFAIGREYEKLRTAVRLHFTGDWETRAGKAKSAGAAMTREERAWRRTHRAEIDEAEAEQAAYYARNFAEAPERARRDAVSAIDALLGAALAEEP